MSWNRFQSDRDFLRENKQNVRYWMTNGRMAAAAQAQKSTRWRPVVLHYPEKLRPHVNSTAARRGRMPTREYESCKLRSGLAQPYGFTEDDHELRKATEAHCQCKALKRAQGGWTDQGIQGSQTDDIKDVKFLSKALDKVKTNKKTAKETTRKQSPISQEPKPKASNEVIKKPSKHGVDYQKAVNNNKPSKIPMDAGASGDAGNEAPLSARSNDSIKTIKSCATIKSQASYASRVSTKSNATIRSNATIKSKSSTMTRKEAQNRLLQAEKHPGYAIMNAEERQLALDDAYAKYADLIQQYNRLPVSESTLRVRNRKVAIERELDELDYTIHMYEQPSMYVRHN